MCRIVAVQSAVSASAEAKNSRDGVIEDMNADKTTRRPLKRVVAWGASLAALSLAIPALAMAAPGPAPADAPEARITQAPRGLTPVEPERQTPEAPTVQITVAPRF